MALQIPDKESLLKKDLEDEIKPEVEKMSWIALQRYYRGASNGPEAKIAIQVLGTIAKEHQAENNRRQLNLVVERMSQKEKEIRLLEKEIK